MSVHGFVCARAGVGANMCVFVAACGSVQSKHMGCHKSESIIHKQIPKTKECNMLIRVFLCFLLPLKFKPLSMSV